MYIVICIYIVYYIIFHLYIFYISIIYIYIYIYITRGLFKRPILTNSGGDGGVVGHQLDNEGVLVCAIFKARQHQTTLLVSYGLVYK